MEKEKVVFFVDYAAITRAARERRHHLDYYDFLQYIGENRFLIDAYCYVPTHGMRNEIDNEARREENWIKPKKCVSL